MVRVWRLVGVVACAAVVVAGCGDDGGGDGGADAAGSGGSASSGDVVSAVLGIITTNIDTDTGEGFADATEGEELVVGDRVRTDATGFAELTYHDGSWMRVESEATLTVEDLADSSEGQVVSTSIDTGEAWSRVVDLAEPEDEFGVDTPVASAAVRGTAFSIDCAGDESCTFSVVEGEVLVTPDTGDPVTLTAGQTLTVTAGEEPPAPEEPGVEALSAEPFIAKNLELDEEKATDDTDDTGDDGDSDDEGASGSIAGSFAGLQTIQSVEFAPDALVPPGNEVGDSLPIQFVVAGPCTTGADCELTFARPGAPNETMSLDVTGQRAAGTANWTRTNGQCSWSEEWSIELIVENDGAAGSVTYEPESLAIECGEGRARPASGTATFEVTRSGGG